MYPGVPLTMPTWVKRTSVSWTAMPKSARREWGQAFPRGSNMMLAGFTSRWIQPSSWMWARPSSSCSSTTTTAGSASLPFFLTTDSRVPPETSGIAITTCSSSAPQP